MKCGVQEEEEAVKTEVGKKETEMAFVFEIFLLVLGWCVWVVVSNVSMAV